MRSREFSLETLCSGIADSAALHAKMTATWAIVLCTHATNTFFSTSFIGLIRQMISAKAPRTASRPTEGETRNERRFIRFVPRLGTTNAAVM
jgi:hypothetical protein